MKPIITAPQAVAAGVMFVGIVAARAAVVLPLEAARAVAHRIAPPPPPVKSNYRAVLAAQALAAYERDHAELAQIIPLAQAS